MTATTGTSKARKRKLPNNSKAPRKCHDWGQRLGVYHISLSKGRVKLSVPGPQAAAAAAAKAFRSCPTLCDPIDGSPPDSSVPGILQARILEWVAISFSNA